MTLDELYREANRLAREHWGVDYTDKITLVNRKWKSRTACFICANNYGDDGCFTHYSDHEIRFSQPVNETLGREKVLDYLLHELVHWRLCCEGLPFSDSDPEFVRECMRVGAVFSETKLAKKAAARYGERGDV